MSLRCHWVKGMLLLLMLGVTHLSYAQTTWQKSDATLKVQIDGVEDELLQNARAYLTLKSLDGQQVPSIFRVRYLARQGEKELMEALEPFGYYNATVTSEIIEGEDEWTVTYHLDKGPQTTFGNINIELLGSAQYDAAFQETLRNSGVKSGQPFIHLTYDRLKSSLRNMAAERGYYDATFTTNSVKVERQQRVAHVNLTFESGERYLFGETTFCCAFLGEDLLNRYLDYQRGEPFSTRTLLDLQIDLAGSDYFNTVEVSPRWDQATENQVPIDVTLSPNERDRYQFGLGYGTDTGARITLGFDRRWLNDRGHRLSSMVRLSEIQNTGYVSYIIPGSDPARDSYSINGEISDRSFEEQRSTLYRTSLKDLRHYDLWHRTYQLAYQREDFAFGDQPLESSSFLVPSIEWSLINSSSLPSNRNIIDDGYRISIMLQGAHDSVLADTTFAAVKLSGKWVHRLSDKWRVLMRSEIGALKADDFDVLGPTLRFFAGGDHSVRGYAYQQLGPTNEEGVVVGGRFMTASSIEMDYAFKPNWRAAIFTDIGNSMMEWDERLKQTVGVGVRWVSPIGPVRLDVAMAIDEPDSPWRIHLTLGPDL